MSTILFLDLETTGVNDEENGIIEIAAEIHQDGKKISEFNKKFFNNSLKVDLGALRVNRVSYSALKSLGDEEVATRSFVDWLLQHKIDRLCGHNVHFDVRFLKALFKRHDIKNFDAVIPYKVYDTCDRGEFLINVGLLSTDKGKSSLNLLAEALKVPFNEKDLHTGKGDVELTAKVYYAMNNLLKEKHDKT